MSSGPNFNQRAIWALVILTVLVVGAVLAMQLRHRNLTTFTPLAGTLVKIHTQGSDSPDSAQDVVEFSDGSKLEGIGFDVTQVGAITLSEASPVYLFKAYSCRGCEPDIFLVAYSPQTQQKVVRPYPGQHVLMDENQKETPDAQFAATFGTCDGADPILLIASKTREADSDGMSLQGGQDWQFLSTKLTFDRKGQIRTDETSADSFFDVQRLTEAGCKGIEPEDRMDYL